MGSIYGNWVGQWESDPRKTLCQQRSIHTQGLFTSSSSAITLLIAHSRLCMTMISKHSRKLGLWHASSASTQVCFPQAIIIQVSTLHPIYGWKWLERRLSIHRSKRRYCFHPSVIHWSSCSSRTVTSDHVSDYIALKFREDNHRGSVKALELVRL